MNEYITTKKFCIKYSDINTKFFVNKCEDNKCVYWNKEENHPCSFSKFSKVLENAIKTEFKTTCNDAKKMSRLLMLNTYQK